MKRKFLVLAATAALVLSACGTSGSATDSGAASGSESAAVNTVNWPGPGKIIQLYVGFAPGGTSDISARNFAAILEKETGARVQVVNQQGAGTQLSQQSMLAQPADGYSMSLVSMPAVLASIFTGEEPPFKKEDFGLLGVAAASVNALIVRGDSPYQTVGDFVADAKTKTLNVGDNGGAEDAMVFGQLEELGGVKLNRVIYNGSPEKVQGLLKGDVAAFCGTTGGVQAQVESGEFRILAQWQTERTPLTQDIPTATEQGYPIAYDSLHGFAMSGDVPEEIRQAAEDALLKVCKNQEYIGIQAELALTAPCMTGAEFSEVWSNYETVIAEAGQKYKV